MKRSLFLLISLLFIQVVAYATDCSGYLQNTSGQLCWADKDFNTSDYTSGVTFPYTFNIVNAEAKTVEICSNEQAWTISGNAYTDVKIPETVTYKGATYTIVQLGRSLFQGNYYITSVEIPTTVEAIGGTAFNNCTALKSITFLSPCSVKSIGEDAFEGCSSLLELIIPDSVECIDHNAFVGCSSLTMVVFGSGVTYIGTFDFDGCNSLELIVMTGTTAPTIVGEGWTSGNRDYPAGTFQGIPKDCIILYPEGGNYTSEDAEKNKGWEFIITHESISMTIEDYIKEKAQEGESVCIPNSEGECDDSYCRNADGSVKEDMVAYTYKCTHYDTKGNIVNEYISVTYCDDSYNPCFDPNVEDKDCKCSITIGEDYSISGGYVDTNCNIVTSCDDNYNPNADPENGDSECDDHSVRYVDPDAGVAVTICDEDYNPALDPTTDVYCPDYPTSRYTDPFTGEKVYVCSCDYNSHLDPYSNDYCSGNNFTEGPLGRYRIDDYTTKTVTKLVVTKKDDGSVESVETVTETVTCGWTMTVCDDEYCDKIDENHPIYVDEEKGKTLTPCDEDYCNPNAKYTVAVDSEEVEVYECTDEYNENADPDSDNYCEKIDEKHPIYKDENGKTMTPCDEGYCNPLPKYKDLDGNDVYECTENYNPEVDPDSDKYCDKIDDKHPIYVGEEGVTMTPCDEGYCNPLPKYYDPEGNPVYECNDSRYNPKADPDSEEYCDKDSDGNELEVPGGRYVDPVTGKTVTVCDENYVEELDPKSDSYCALVKGYYVSNGSSDEEEGGTYVEANKLESLGDSKPGYTIVSVVCCDSEPKYVDPNGKLVYECDDNYNPKADPNSDEYCDQALDDSGNETDTKLVPPGGRYVDEETGMTITPCDDDYSTENDPYGDCADNTTRYKDPLRTEENEITICSPYYNPYLDYTGNCGVEPSSVLYEKRDFTCATDEYKACVYEDANGNEKLYKFKDRPRYIDPTTGKTVTICETNYNPHLDPESEVFCAKEDETDEPDVRYWDPFTQTSVTSCDDDYNEHMDPNSDYYCDPSKTGFTPVGRYRDYDINKTITVCDPEYNPYADPNNEEYCDTKDGKTVDPVIRYHDPETGRAVTLCDENYNPKADPNDEDNYCDTDPETDEPLGDTASGGRYTDETGKVITKCDDEYNPHADPDSDEYCGKDEDGNEIDPVIRYTDPETGKVVTVCDDNYNPKADPNNEGNENEDERYCDRDPETGELLDPAGGRYVDENGKWVTVCDDEYNPHADPNSDEYCEPTDEKPVIRYTDPETGKVVTVCDENYNPHADPNNESEDDDNKYCTPEDEKPVIRYTDPETGKVVTVCDDEYNPHADPNDGDEYCTPTETDADGNLIPAIRYTDPETGKVVTVCDEDIYNPHADPNSDDYCEPEVDEDGNEIPVIRYVDPETGIVVTVCDDNYNPQDDPYSDEYCPDPTKGYNDPVTGEFVSVCDENYNPYLDENSDDYCTKSGDPYIDPDTGKTLSPCDEGYCWGGIRYQDPRTGKYITYCDEEWNIDDEDRYKDGWERDDPDCDFGYFDDLKDEIVYTCDDDYNPSMDPNNDDYCDPDVHGYPLGRYVDENGKTITVCDDEYNPHADPNAGDEYCEPTDGKPVIRYTDPETGMAVTVCDEDIYNPHADPNSDEYCEPTDGKPVIRYVDPETGKVVTVCDDNYDPREDPYSDDYCDPAVYGEPIIRYEDPFTKEEITVCDDDYNPYLDPNSGVYCDMYGDPVGRYQDPETGWSMTACDDGYDSRLDPNSNDYIYKDPLDEDDPKEEDDATEQEPDDPTEKLDDEHKTVLDTDIEEQPGVEEIIPDEVIIRAEDTSIFVSTPTLSRVTVNDLSGVMLIDEMVEGTVKLEVGSRGLFIVKVGHVLEKVLLK